MFDKYTDRARRVVVLAQEESRLLSHNYIGTEHLLLGLIQEREGIAARVLAEMGIGLDRVRAELLGKGQQVPSGHIPFTPRAKKVLELALREALQLGQNYIGTEHILLGLIREGEGVAAQILVRLGAGLEGVRDHVREHVGTVDIPVAPPGVLHPGVSPRLAVYVYPDGGESFPVECGSRIIGLWEQQFRGAHLSNLRRPSMTDIQGIAFVGAVQAGKYEGNLNDFRKTHEVGIVSLNLGSLADLPAP